MKKFVINLLIAATVLSASAQSSNPYLLWYESAAGQFEEALPLGNGRLGVMVYGGVRSERLSLNEATLWAGDPLILI